MTQLQNKSKDHPVILQSRISLQYSQAKLIFNNDSYITNEWSHEVVYGCTLVSLNFHIFFGKI
jgi:hypothetical protein